jgi:hypothetical protein
MGNFYTNYTLRGPAQKDVAAALAGRNAIVTPPISGSLVVFDEASDDQNHDHIAELAEMLSSRFQCPVLAVLNHDDDILWYQLYDNGRLTDEYDSAPDYFEPAAEPEPPKGGDARLLCAAFGSSRFEDVDEALRKPSADERGYTFAFERHLDLVKALTLPDIAVGASYSSFESDQCPEGLSPGDLIRTS